jgi:2-phosphoglycerate kinase
MARHDVTLHILYGVPCVGKSTAAIAFACHQNIRTVVHTDYLREVQRGYVTGEVASVLAKVTHNAWELYGLPTHRNIVTGFVDHVEAVAPAIGIVVRKLVGDGFDAVVERAHFHGKIIKDLRSMNGHADIQATLLIARTADELRQRISHKGRARASGVPLQEWQENLPFMLTIQDYLISDAHANDIRVSTVDGWRSSWSPVASQHSTWIMP